MKIYCAGKIEHKDWRTNFYFGQDIDLIRDPQDDGICPTGFDDWQNLLPDEWPVIPIGKNDYTGPYFLRCDHGCFHGPNSHGVGADELKKHRAGVVRLCESAIHKSDAMFVWLDDVSAYGTIAEIGYAAALNKRIVVYGPERFDDMWFVYQMASKTVILPSLKEDELPDIVRALK